jgi:site-specific recombinase
LEAYLLTDTRDEAALRSVRMLLGVCRAQTDRIYAHLDEYGVSVGLVYSVERMRAQLARIGRLVDLHAAPSAEGQAPGQVQALLVDLIEAHHRRSSLRSLLRRNFSLLSRKMVERNASHGEHYIARDRTEYRAMLNAAYRGGIITAFTAFGKIMLSGAGLARFFEGAFNALSFSVSFLAIQAVGGALATKQPAVTAPALAARMGALDTVDGLRALVLEIAWLLRSQSAAVFGNLMAVIPAMIAISFTIAAFSGAALMPVEKAHASLHALSLFGPTPLFAALTGVLLWLSSLVAGFADNWFALRQLRDALACNRRLVYALGAARAARWAQWLENNVAGIAGNVAIGILLGMTPVLAQFFGLPLDVRHVTLSTGTLTAAVMSLGWDTLATPEFWLAVGGIAIIGLLNVGVAFSCALALALRAREVPARIKRVVLRTVWKRFCASPFSFLLPEKNDAGSAAQADASLTEQQNQDEEKREIGKM